MRVKVSWAIAEGSLTVSGTASMKSQVAGKGTPGPDEVEMIPIASPVDPVNQPDGTGSEPPRSVRGPVTPPAVTAYLGCTVAASGSILR